MSLALSEEPVEVLTIETPTSPPLEEIEDEPEPIEKKSEEKPRPQWIYIQTPKKFTTKCNNNGVNIVPPLQMIASSKSTISKQNLLLTSNTVKPQQILIQKPTGSTTMGKNTVALITMIKPKNESNLLTPVQIGSINKVKTDELHVSSAQKVVITPMPKITSNRLPTTVTTNCTKTKFTLMPLKGNQSLKQKFFNLTDDIKVKSTKDMEIIVNSPKEICLSEDKSYQLSIPDNDYDTISDDEKSKTIVERIRQGFNKQGVSILRKTIGQEDKGGLIISPVITTETKDLDKEKEPSMIVTECRTYQKSERRRKSIFSYRKDEDSKWKETEFDTDVTLTKLENCNDKQIVSEDDVVEIKVVKDKPDINMNEDFDVKKILVWENGVGTLPGSNLKFHINEFGILEYIKNDELNNAVEVKKTKINKSDLQDELRCLECGCYGQPTEFINSEYCSFDCKETANNKLNKESDLIKDIKFKKKKKRTWLKRLDAEIKMEMKSEKDASGSDEETSENSDKFNYPWHCRKKGFSWSKYLDHIKAKAAPVKLFKDPFPYNRNGFRPCMKLEGVDPQHPSYFCVLTVAEVIGYRLRLHFDGYPANYDFWINADSMDIFPAGWCEKYGHVLHPPPGYTVTNFNWNVYIKSTRSTMAPKHLFANRAGNAICPNGFRVGMKLEAVDKKNSSLVCVATIVDMMDNRFLVHFDSWDDIYDYWADPTSPYIHPVGWCEQYGHKLTPPNDYPNKGSFTWEKYLKETKTVAAPVRAFKQKPPCGYKKGMRLECVDKRVPQLIRVATVDDVKDHQIRVTFDGWPDKYGYWVDSDSIDIHPVGWCQKTAHPIEPPLTPNDVYDFLECPTVGCKGQGHTRGPKYSRHSSQKYCPYSEENLNCDKILPDRLLSPDRQPQAAVPVAIEPRDKPKPKPRSLKIKSEPSSPIEIKDDSYEDVEMKERKSSPLLKRKYVQAFGATDMRKKFPFPNGYFSPFSEQIWSKYSKTLLRDVKLRKDPRMWSETEVQLFIASFACLEESVGLFKKHNIDGESLLMLSQQDIVDILGIKLGPAIKLYSTILLLRQHIA